MAVNICTAVKQGDAEMLRKLLEAGADPETYCSKEGFLQGRGSSGSKSLFYLAVENENLQVLKILLEDAKNLRLQKFLYKKPHGGLCTEYTPMNIAVLRNNEKIVHQIIERLTGEPALARIFNLLEENIRLTINSKQYKMFDYLIGELTKKVDNQYSTSFYMPFDGDYGERTGYEKYTILSELGPEEKYFKDRLLEIGVQPTNKDIQKEATEGNLELVEKLKSRQEESKLLREERSKKVKEQKDREWKKRRKKQKLKDDYGFWAIMIGILIILVLLL